MYKRIKNILTIVNTVSQHKTKEQQDNLIGVGLIAAAAFIAMSILNIIQKSQLMFIFTASSAILLLIAVYFSKLKRSLLFLKCTIYIICIVVFTAFTIMGGNEGFATLWLLIATYAGLFILGFKAGFSINAYYAIMLVLVFYGPLKNLLQYEYSPTFMLRYPFLYAVNFAFATFISVRDYQHQYKMIVQQEKLQELSNTDLNTKLSNRNCFIQFEKTFSPSHLKTLAAIFIDVNGLHELNNREGHDAGDKMLCCVAALCKTIFPNDKVYRMGGDEFLILSENASSETVEYKAKQLFDAVDENGYSISYGIEIQDSNFDLTALVTKADEQMNVFKRKYYQNRGRDRRQH